VLAIESAHFIHNKHTLRHLMLCTRLDPRHPAELPLVLHIPLQGVIDRILRAKTMQTVVVIHQI
jgi:hypothetical protein